MSVFCGTCGFLEPCKCTIVRCKAGEGPGERIVELEREIERLRGVWDEVAKVGHRVQEHKKRADRVEAENRALRERLEKGRDIATLIDEGFLVRSIKDDTDQGGALKILPQVRRLAVAVDALRELDTPDATPEHCCGLQGFGASGDVCPACDTPDADEKNTPGLLDMRGALPDIIPDGETSEGMIRKIRDKWPGDAGEG